MINGRCFLAQGATKNFFTAQMTCQAMGGKVAEPMDAAELAAIGAIRDPSNRDVWVGFTDVINEGTFVLASDPSVDVTATILPLWQSGEPNNGGGGGGGSDCARFRRQSGMLADWNCNHETQAGCVCEFPPTVVFPADIDKFRSYYFLTE